MESTCFGSSIHSEYPPLGFDTRVSSGKYRATDCRILWTWSESIDRSFRRNRSYPPVSMNSATTDCASDGEASVLINFSSATCCRNLPASIQPRRQPPPRILENEDTVITSSLVSKAFRHFGLVSVNVISP